MRYLVGDQPEVLMVVQATFFDIDGTLVDSNEFHVHAWIQGS